MSVQTLLNEEIKSEFDELKKMELGSDKYEKTVNGLTKLVDKAIEMEKFDMEYDEKVKSRENDETFKQTQLIEDRKDRKAKNYIAVAGILIPVGVTIWGTLKSFKFEQEGTITTIMGRGFINKLLPKK